MRKNRAFSVVFAAGAALLPSLAIAQSAGEGPSRAALAMESHGGDPLRAGSTNARPSAGAALQRAGALVSARGATPRGSMLATPRLGSTAMRPATASALSRPSLGAPRTPPVAHAARLAQPATAHAAHGETAGRTCDHAHQCNSNDASARPELILPPRLAAARAAANGTAPPPPQLILPGHTEPGDPATLIVPGRAEPRPDARILTLAEARRPAPQRFEPGGIARLARLTPDGIARTLLARGDFRALATFCRGRGQDCFGRAARLSDAQRRGAALLVRHAAGRSVYDMERLETFENATRIRSEGDGPSRNAMGDLAYERAGAVYEAFRVIFGRESINDRAMPIVSAINYGVDVDNAFWDGERMSYGSARNNIDSATTGHEMGHGVTGTTAQLVYQGESGALNEHFSDVLGQAVKQWLRNDTVRSADWLQSVRVAVPGQRGPYGFVRSIADPHLGRSPQPAHMREYVRTERDNGGVHINSGIPNRAFYGAATRIGGHVWERTARVWYVALRDHLGPNATFRDAARATVQVAGDLFGVGSREQQAVIAGWGDVGIRVRMNSAPMPIRTATAPASGQ